MPKYVAKRKDVCAGQLLKMEKKIYKAFNEFDNDSNKQYLEIQGVAGLPVSGAIICRGMLFNVDMISLANDLIYTTPINYPIYGIPPKVDIESEFVINNYVELDDLLIYLKYGVDLTQKDLDKIYISLITHNSWLRSNMELFGWKKNNKGYGYSTIQTIPMTIYHNLSSISSFENGNPYIEEPGYSLIKKR